MADPVVIDLSHWNPTPDWDRLKASGVVGVIHKATEATSYVDPTLFERIAEASAAGLLTATYHFLRPGQYEAQIDHYLDTVNPVQGERVCLDHEDPGVSLDDLVECVLLIAAKRPDLQITIYSGHVIKEQLGDGFNEVLAEATDLWIAHYTSGMPEWPARTWPEWSLWQYTDKAEVPGISAPVDGDRWNGDEASLIAWLSPAAVPVPEPDARVVNVQVTASEGVTVFVTVNGQTR